MTTPEPLWSDERIEEAIAAVSTHWHDADEEDWLWRKVDVLGAHSEAPELMQTLRDDYEAERAAHLARIAELELELAERGEWANVFSPQDTVGPQDSMAAKNVWEPVPAGKYNDAWEILPDGACSVRDHKGHLVVSDWPDGWRLMRRKAGAEEE